MSPFIRFLLVPAPCQSIICRNRQSSRNREPHAILVEFKSSGFVMDEATAKLIAEKGVWLSLDRLLWLRLAACAALAEHEYFSAMLAPFEDAAQHPVFGQMRSAHGRRPIRHSPSRLAWSKIGPRPAIGWQQAES